jgi:hypothetical protein
MAAARVERDEAIRKAIDEYNDNVVKPMSEALVSTMEAFKAMTDSQRLMTANVHRNTELVNRNTELVNL